MCRAKDSISVNCVSPWYIATDLALQVPREKEKEKEMRPPVAIVAVQYAAG